MCNYNFGHIFFKVLIFIMTLCLRSKKEIMFLLLKSILKYSFTSSSTKGAKDSSLIHFQKFDFNLEMSSLFLTLSKFKIEKIKY